MRNRIPAAPGFSRPQEAIHILLGDSVAGTFKDCEGIVLRDCLVIGPCAAAPVLHGQKRRAFWQDWLLEGPWSMSARARRQIQEAQASDLLSAEQLAAALAVYPPAQPILLWTAALWMERLSFWWTLDAIRRSRMPRERFWLAQPPLTDPAESSLGCFCRAQLDEAFANRRPLDAATLRSGSDLWRKYASSSPKAFDAARRGGVSCFPDLAAVAERHGWFFPQVGPRSTRLRLSRIDQALFDHLQADDWIRPHALIRDRSFFEDYLFLAGDEMPLWRLHQWATYHADDPVLLSRPERGASDWVNVSYRMTTRGERLRRNGLEHAQEAPPLFIGGCSVYRGNNPWVRRGSRAHWRIERLNEG